jgi:metal-responsive CopG/Arc/MetJ family transcriptional regulator
VQVFTRLTIAQTEQLDKIGNELGLFIERNGEVNRSEVIRRLLAKADRRMIDRSNHPSMFGREE